MLANSSEFTERRPLSGKFIGHIATQLLSGMVWLFYDPVRPLPCPMGAPFLYDLYDIALAPAISMNNP